MCQGGCGVGVGGAGSCPLPPPGVPLVGPTQGQLPHLPAAMVLLGCPLAQLARLLADGRQGLVTGTIIPTTFLRTQDEGESQPPTPHPPPNPLVNLIFRPAPASNLLCDSEHEACPLCVPDCPVSPVSQPALCVPLAPTEGRGVCVPVPRRMPGTWQTLNKQLFVYF